MPFRKVARNGKKFASHVVGWHGDTAGVAMMNGAEIENANRLEWLHVPCNCRVKTRPTKTVQNREKLNGKKFAPYFEED